MKEGKSGGVLTHSENKATRDEISETSTPAHRTTATVIAPQLTASVREDTLILCRFHDRNKTTVLDYR